jgi:hypothetical protein
MTKENDNAQEKALEALITASLRCPDMPRDITEEEIRRYVEQQVTLSAEDEAALEKSKPGLMRSIRDILQGNEQEDDCLARPSGAERAERIVSLPSRRATDEFVEAVVIAQLTRLLATSDFPLGRMRYNKLAYLSHRKADEDVAEHYLKKAAGPYSPWAQYQGPEAIALRNGYVKHAKAGRFEGLIAGDQVGKIDEYLSHYPVCAALNWVVSTFRFRKNEELELLATVDFAALDLIRQGAAVTAESVKDIIATNKEWKPKLKRAVFSDERISQALAELRGLFPGTYA